METTSSYSKIYFSKDLNSLKRCIFIFVTKGESHGLKHAACYDVMSGNCCSRELILVGQVGRGPGTWICMCVLLVL